MKRYTIKSEPLPEMVIRTQDKYYPVQEIRVDHGDDPEATLEEISHLIDQLKQCGKICWRRLDVLQRIAVEKPLHDEIRRLKTLVGEE